MGRIVVTDGVMAGCSACKGRTGLRPGAMQFARRFRADHLEQHLAEQHGAELHIGGGCGLYLR